MELKLEEKATCDVCVAFISVVCHLDQPLLGVDVFGLSETTSSEMAKCSAHGLSPCQAHAGERLQKNAAAHE
jgi:hypothetical protein